MKNVLEIMNYASPYAGNFIASVDCLCRTLQTQGRQTVLVFPERARQCDWMQTLRQDRPVFFLPRGTVRTARFLRRLCRQYDVGTVHTHFIDKSVYVPLRAALSGRGTAHIFHAHSLPKFPTGGVRLRLRRALMHTTRVLCVSDAVREAYAARGFANCETVYNGIAFSRLDTGEAAPLPEPAVLMFGYDTHIKGVDTALDAFAAFDTAHRYTLCIAAAGHARCVTDFLRARFGETPDWVRVLGPTQDVGAYYRAANVFLSASRTEGLPYAVPEAVYCGLPTALSDIPAHRELNAPGAAYFPPEDAAALFAAVETAAAGTPEIEAYRRFCARFTLDAWARTVSAKLRNETETIGGTP